MAQGLLALLRFGGWGQRGASVAKAPWPGWGLPLGPTHREGAVATQRDHTDKRSRGRMHILRIPWVVQCSWREPGSQ